ncbi:MAG: TIGR04255 family protein [Thermodesulfobacteriota bacterium]
MEKIILSKKPLVEAIFELKWQLKEIATNINIDPEYKLLVGIIYDRIKKDYPSHQSLDSTNIPDEFSGYVVQHRFRKGENSWPLVQLGPGIITLNDTKEYDWDDFKERIINVSNVLFDVYPESHIKLKIKSALIRYIDAIEFDYDKENILSFLKDKLKIEVKVHEKLFDNTGVNNLPSFYDLKFSFKSGKPRGIIRIRFVKGRKQGSDSLIWETTVESIGEDAPSNIGEINIWVEEAHRLTHDWFFKLIEGELYARFK